MLEKYGHGGDLLTAAETFGLQPSEFVDFSSNMNPLGPPEAVKNVLRSYADRIQAYPDPASRELRHQLSQLHGVDESRILIGNGAAELIDLAVRAIRPTTTALAAPCFAEYGDAARKIGSRIHEVRLLAEQGFELHDHHIDEALEQSGAELYMLGTPNNPTGKAARPALVRRLLASGAFVVLDEAFIHFMSDGERRSMIAEAAQSERLIVLRSMTKFYSIPGIRLGYAVASQAMIEQMRELQVPWSVNSLAQWIGAAVLGDEAFAARTMEWLLREREWLSDGLRVIGMVPFDSEANYLLVRLPDTAGLTAAEWQRELGCRGVLIRDASRFPGLDGRYIRVAVKQRLHNEILLHAMKDVIRVNGLGGTPR